MPHKDPEVYRSWRRTYDANNRERIRARQRELRTNYGKKCLGCGSLTDGSNGADKAPLYCRLCDVERRRVWSDDAIIGAIQLYFARYGKPPGATDFEPSLALKKGRDDWAERFYSDGDYPYANTVKAAFGSWSAGISAAGFEPRGIGKRGPNRPRA